MNEIASVQWFAEKLGDRTMRGIAIETALIRAGAIPVGTKLPAIRDLALTLGISPATVSEAWSELRRQKIITGRGRNGTWVSGDRIAPRPARLASAGDYGDGSSRPLYGRSGCGSAATARRGTQGVALGRKSQQLPARPYPPGSTGCRRTALAYRPAAFLATNGGYNAVYALLHALIMPGSFIAIEDPTAMRMLDILEDLGVHILPVQCDADGPLPESLASALRGPAASLFQPRTHSVTGGRVSKAPLQRACRCPERQRCTHHRG